MPSGTEKPLGGMNVGAMWASLGGGISNAERARRRANALRVATQRQSNRLARQRTRQPSPPKRASPPRKSPSPPKRASPPRKSPSPPKRPNPNQEYATTIARIATNNWKRALSNAARAFVRAGLARNANDWKRKVAGLYAERARRTRNNRKRGQDPIHGPVAGNENYIPSMYNNKGNHLRKLLSKLN
jgi:hypothetical protein